MSIFLYLAVNVINLVVTGATVKYVVYFEVNSF